MAHPYVQEGMIGLPDGVWLFSLAPVKKVVGSPVGFGAVVSQRDQGGIKALHDSIHPMIIGNRPSVAQRHITHLSVDKGRGRRRCAQREPFNDLGEFGVQSVWLSSVTALTTGEASKAIAPVLGEPPLHGS